MRCAVVSPYHKGWIKEKLKNHGFFLSRKPSLVFTYGGDGTILEAERKFPGIPIVPIQKSTICSHCSVYTERGLDITLHHLMKGHYRIREEPKVEALFKGKRIRALNEIQVHIRDPRRALRFSLRAPGKNYRELMGDGLVFSTGYGSRAYYRSLGYAPFKRGIRIGFNNVFPKLPYIKLKGKARVQILRKDAWLIADNHFIRKMKKGDAVNIMPSIKKSKFVVLKN